MGVSDSVPNSFMSPLHNAIRDAYNRGDMEAARDMQVSPHCNRLPKINMQMDHFLIDMDNQIDRGVTEMTEYNERDKLEIQMTTGDVHACQLSMITFPRDGRTARLEPTS